MLIFQGSFNRCLDSCSLLGIFKCANQSITHHHLRRLLVWGTSGFAPSNGMLSRALVFRRRLAQHRKISTFCGIFSFFFSFWAHNSNYSEEQFWRPAWKIILWILKQLKPKNVLAFVCCYKFSAYQWNCMNTECFYLCSWLLKVYMALQNKVWYQYCMPFHFLLENG